MGIPPSPAPIITISAIFIYLRDFENDGLLLNISFTPVFAQYFLPRRIKYNLQPFLMDRFL